MGIPTGSVCGGESERQKTTVRFPCNDSFCPRSSKMSSSCQKSIHNATLFINLIHPVIDFAREERVLLSALRIFLVNSVSSNSKAVLSVVSLCSVVFSGRSKASASGSTPTNPVPAPRRGRKPSPHGRRCVGLRPTPKISATREKNLWYPG